MGKERFLYITVLWEVNWEYKWHSYCQIMVKSMFSFLLLFVENNHVLYVLIHHWHQPPAMTLLSLTLDIICLSSSSRRNSALCDIFSCCFLQRAFNDWEQVFFTEMQSCQKLCRELTHISLEHYNLRNVQPSSIMHTQICWHL